MSPYRGRFAPSPSGALHFGSLVAAVGSYLDARAHGGEWLLRIEDLDPPRDPARRSRPDPGGPRGLRLPVGRSGAAPSERFDAYADAIAQLGRARALRDCRCSRSALAPAGEPGATHRHRRGAFPSCGLPSARAASAPGSALRLRVPAGAVALDDRSLPQSVDAAATGGDFVLRRRDGLYAYQLAVVVDDAAQGITDVVRGCDLLGSTARQVLLQRALGLPSVRYMHLPLAVDDRGLKLSKSGNAPAVGNRDGLARCLVSVLEFLGQSPPLDLARAPLDQVWEWALGHWRIEGFAGCASRTAPQVAC